MRAGRTFRTVRPPSSWLAIGGVLGAVIGAAATWTTMTGMRDVVHAASSRSVPPAQRQGTPSAGQIRGVYEKGHYDGERPPTRTKVATATDEQGPESASGVRHAEITPSVQALQSRIEQLQRQQRTLRSELRTVEEELKASEAQAPYAYDVSPDEWRNLAARSLVRFRIPCDEGMRVNPDGANFLGLSPTDAATTIDALRRSRERLWQVISPACTDMVGDPFVAELLGQSGCQDLVAAAASKSNPAAEREASRLVAEVRAGLREPPSAQEATTLLSMYMALTEEGPLFEKDLAESFGPEEAKRIWHDFPCSISYN